MKIETYEFIIEMLVSKLKVKNVQPEVKRGRGRPRKSQESL